MGFSDFQALQGCSDVPKYVMTRSATDLVRGAEMGEELFNTNCFQPIDALLARYFSVAGRHPPPPDPHWKRNGFGGR